MMMSEETKATPTVEEAAFALYKPPFRFEYGFVWDADNHMVADHPAEDAALRIRGWGRIGYKPNAEALQDKVGELIAQAMTEFWEKRNV